MTNRRNHFLKVLVLILSVFVLFSACRTIVIDSGGSSNGGKPVRPHKPPHKPHKKPERGIRKGDVVTVTGRVERDGNHYYIHDVNASRTFRVVSLGQHEKNALYKRNGRIVRIRLKVISVESKFSFVTHFVSLR